MCVCLQIVLCVHVSADSLVRALEGTYFIQEAVSPLHNDPPSLVDAVDALAGAGEEGAGPEG